LFVAFTLICFALSPRAQAVVPAPDGGYANENAAEGDSALFSLTTGQQNTALGFAALGSDTSGDYNTATGSGALNSNKTGSENTATGAGALFSNFGGMHNTATGVNALEDSAADNANDNTATGFQALQFNLCGSPRTQQTEVQRLRPTQPVSIILPPDFKLSSPTKPATPTPRVA
jgi:hypothetical protein